MSKLISLGIESTAHTFGVGIIDEDGNIMANERKLFTTEEGGMIPAEVADHHTEEFHKVIETALEKANISLKDVGIITYSQSPGIGNCLRIGSMVARSLATLLKIPLVGVNHCVAHLEIGKLLCKSEDPVFLYASGANTQIIAFEGGKYRIFGETLDIGIGNFIDTFARTIGLGFPGGPKVYDLSLKAKEMIDLPYSVKGMDVAFGGLLTNLKNKWATGKYTKEDLCYSLQETAYAMLVEVVERAMAHTGKKEVLLGGGVACNIRLQEMCKIMCEERGAKFFVPQRSVLIDNGLMIAWLGILEYKAGRKIPVEKANILPYLRTDEVEVAWTDQKSVSA